MALKPPILLMAVMGSVTAVHINSIAVTPINSTISCNWSNATQVVGDIQAAKLNVTDIVAQCANVCDIAFASSIPEISGEGVMISCFIQTALACLFGPLLPLLIWFIALSSRQTLVRSITLLRKLQHSVYEINAFFSISLVVAAIVRHHQNPSILEISFFSSLFLMESLVAISMIWAQFGDSLLKLDSTGKLGWPWNLFYVAICVAILVTSAAIGLPDGTMSVYNQLAKECHNQHQFPDLSNYLSPSAGGKSALKWLGVGMAVSIGGSILFGVLGIALARYLGKIIPQWVKKHGLNIFVTLLLLYYVSVIIVDAVKLNNVRRILEKMSGGVVQNDWGYGETTAILLWAPFVWATIKETIKHWREPPPVQQPEDEMQVAEAILPPYTPGNDPPPPPPPSGIALP